MGQVPYGLVGSGRLARHLAHYFDLLQIPYRQWSRSSATASSSDFPRILEDCEVWLLAIADGAIEDFVKQIRTADRISKRVFIHFSGALGTDLAHGYHPLMSFGPELYPASVYREIAFIADEDAPPFSDLFPKLPNPSHRIRKQDKALYHALCVMSGNFSVLLWQKLFEELEGRLGIPAQAAAPYLKRIFANLEATPKLALTGPLSRGDEETIRRNLEALEGDAYQEVYQSFVHAWRVHEGSSHEHS